MLNTPKKYNLHPKYNLEGNMNFGGDLTSYKHKLYTIHVPLLFYVVVFSCIDNIQTNIFL